MEKKRLLRVIGVLAIALTIALLPLLTACQAGPSTPGEETVQLIIGGSGPGGGAYAMAVGVQTVINLHLEGVRATAMGTGATANLHTLVEQGSDAMFMCTHLTAFAASAYKGGNENFPDANPQLRIVCPGWGGWFYWLTLDQNIKNLTDLKGKRVAMGGAGTSDPPHCEESLEAIGLKRDVDYDGILLDGYQASEALIDGRVDVMFTSGGLLSGAVTQLDAQKKAYFIPWAEHIDAIVAALADTGDIQTPGKIPSENYKGLTQDYETIGALLGFFAHEDADEELIYRVTKAIWENVEELELIHPVGSEWTLDNVDVDYGLPYHPGAIRYYKEIGILTQDPFKG